MKLQTLKLLLAVVFAVGAINAGGQTAVISSGGFVSVSGEIPGTPVSTQQIIGQPIAANLQFGDVSPNGIWSRRVIMRMPIRISANCNYKVELQRISYGNTGFQPSEIGFGIANVRPQIVGSPDLKTDAVNVSIAGNFGSDSATAPVVNGLPRYQTTLADISETLTTVLRGVPTIRNGSAGKDSNSILVDLIFVIVPQYYTPADASNLKLNIVISAQ